jgi:hypothetical protein
LNTKQNSTRNTEQVLVGQNLPQKHTTTPLTTEWIPQNFTQVNTLHKLKLQLFSLTRHNNFFNNLTNYHPSRKLKSFFKRPTFHPSDLSYKWHMLSRFKANTFQFKSQDSAYEFCRYRFRFIRIFKGTN